MGQNFTIAQSSFAAGELSPSLRARTDLAKFRVGAALMRNFFTLVTGGAASRQGTKAVLRSIAVYGTWKKPRLVPFTFSTTQAYMLEFTYDNGGFNAYMHVLMNGGYVLETAQSITSIAVNGAGQVTITKNAHGYSNNDRIWFSGVTGMTELNSSPGFFGTVTGANANTFRILNCDGVNPPNAANWGAFAAGNMARIYRLSMPFGFGNNLETLKFSQNADTMTITGTIFDVYKLTRSAHTSWTITAITFAPTIQPPGGGAPNGTRTNAGNLVYSYAISSVSDSTGEESVRSAIQVMSAAGELSAALNQDTGVNIKLDWTAPASGPTPDRYNIYKGRPVVTGGVATPPSILGYIGQSTTLDFTDTNIEPDFARGPVTSTNIFSSYGLPGCSTYFGGRQWFGGTPSYPEVIMGTVAANFNNSSQHVPVRADDAIIVGLLSSQVNPIKHLVSLNALLALTTSGAWLVTGDNSDDAITALSIRARPQIYDGCSDIAPLNVSSDVLYLSTSTQKLKTLAYDFNSNLFTGVDVSLLAAHLFIGYTMQAACYSEEPFSTIHVVRSDGEMLVMSYLKEQDVYAWGHYETPGNGGTGVGTDDFVDCASVREGNEDAVYVTTKRTAPGVNSGLPFYMTERFATRVWSDGAGGVNANAVWALDSAVEYSGAAATAMTGLHHMLGATVLVYGDGGLQAERVVGTDGKITLEKAASRVLMGYGYKPQLQTLGIDLGEPSVQGKKKKVSKLTMNVSESRGIKVAPMKDDLNGDSIVGTLYPMRERSTQQTYSSALPFMSGIRSMILDPNMQNAGACQIEGTPGVPCSILSVIPTIMVGDDPG